MRALSVRRRRKRYRCSKGAAWPARRATTGWRAYISPTSRLHLAHISPTSRPHLVQAAPAGVLLAKFVHHVDPEVIDLRALNLPSSTEAELGRAERPQNHTRP